MCHRLHVHEDTCFFLMFVFFGKLLALPEMAFPMLPSWQLSSYTFRQAKWFLAMEMASNPLKNWFKTTDPRLSKTTYPYDIKFGI